MTDLAVVSYSGRMTHTDDGEVDKRVGERVHQLLWRNGLTQTAVAPLLNMEPSTLSRKLHGNRPWTLAELVKIAEILQTTTSYLLGETDDASLPGVEGSGGERAPRKDSLAIRSTHAPTRAARYRRRPARSWHRFSRRRPKAKPGPKVRRRGKVPQPRPG